MGLWKLLKERQGFSWGSKVSPAGRTASRGLVIKHLLNSFLVWGEDCCL